MEHSLMEIWETMGFLARLVAISLIGMGMTCHGIPTDRCIGGNHAIKARLTQGGCHEPDTVIVHVRGDLHSHRHVPAMLLLTLELFVLDGELLRVVTVHMYKLFIQTMHLYILGGKFCIEFFHLFRLGILH